MSLSIKQLAMIPESELKHRILRAAGVEVPPEAFSRQFDLPSGEKLWYTDTDARGPGFTHLRGDSTRFALVDDVLQVCNWAPGTPTGDALRLYLRRWGWLPKSERAQADPQADTRTII